MILLPGGFNPKLSMVLTLIINEVMQAEQKHPIWPTDPLRQTAVVSEEASELLQAQLSLIEGDEALERDIPNLTAEQYLERDKALEDLNQQIIIEAAQTGAMAIRFLMNRLEEIDDDGDGQEDTTESDPSLN
jgi:hypothetical protein